MMALRLVAFGIANRYGKRKSAVQLVFVDTAVGLHSINRGGGIPFPPIGDQFGHNACLTEGALDRL